MATTYLTRTPSSTGNLRTFTISFWVKKCLANKGGDTSQQIIGQTASDYFRLMFLNSTDQFRFYDESGMSKMTTRRFNDPNSWYHFVVRIDTTQGSASDRNRLYVNGVQETSFSTDTNSGQNTELHFNRQHLHSIGRSSSSGGYDYFDGCLSDFILIDGQSLAPTSFAETDTDTGEWKPKQLADNAFTWGTNGFRILKDGMTVTDQSTNSNNWTVGGTLTKTEDSPSNVFATLNPLAFVTAYTLSKGNLTFNGGTITSWVHGVPATMGASSGKYYWEVKWKNGISTSIVGVLPIDKSYHCSDTGGGSVYTYSNSFQLANNGAGTIYNYGASNTNGFQRAHDDVIMFAMDMDNKKLWSGANGTWYNSGNPATGATPLWDTSKFPSDWDNGFIPFCQSYYSGTATEFEFNFGNGYFGTTAVSSAGTNASGNGIFEYNVPAGFTALSTTGLNT